MTPWSSKRTRSTTCAGTSPTTSGRCPGSRGLEAAARGPRRLPGRRHSSVAPLRPRRARQRHAIPRMRPRPNRPPRGRRDDERHRPCPTDAWKSGSTAPRSTEGLTCHRTRKPVDAPPGPAAVRPERTHDGGAGRKPCANSKRPWRRTGSSRTSVVRAHDDGKTFKVVVGGRRLQALPDPGQEAPEQVPHYDADTVPGDPR